MELFMNKTKSLYAYCLSLSLSLSLLALSAALPASELPDGAQESLEEARQLCQGISESNKRLAKSAGYDIDKLCSSLELFELPEDDSSDEQLVLPRNTKAQAADNVKPQPPQVAKKTIEPPRQGELRNFGYDLFAGEPTSFQPASRIPVSPNFILGPGDTVKVLFYGKINESHDLEINRNGYIEFPQLGPVNLAGMTFSDAKQLLQQRIKEEIIGIEASISLGELRSMQVFMLGEAYKPGTYTISALSTMTNALFLSGGLSDIASLRNLQLKRAGKVVATLDLYDLLLHGDTTHDAQLQSGDTIYIPTVKQTASIDGAIRRPAIYELKGAVTAQQLIELGGGLKPTAYRKSARIHRVTPAGFMSAIDIDLSTRQGRKTAIQNGDLLMIDSAVEQQEMIVTLSGHVHHPGEFLWRQELRISDLVKSIKSLQPNADLDFALIRRELPPLGRVQALFVDLRAVLADPKSSANTTFFPRDELMIFSNQGDRAASIAEFVESLKQQSRSGEMAQVATITGTVRSPGEYPLTKGMTLTQLIAAAGGLNEEAYTQVVELSRHDFSNIEKAATDHFAVTLTKALRDPSADLQLQPYDVISVRTIPEFRENLSISLKGEVRFPGNYRFRRGETLSEVIERAGGLTEMAHKDAAVFIRSSLREQEAKRLQELRKRLRADIAARGLEKTNEGKSAGIDDSAKILAELEATEALGRLVIDLDAILDQRVDDVTLKNGDLLVIPQYHQEISVVGEIQHPSAYVFNRQLKIEDYIDLSGGVSHHADRKRVYVVKADGSVSLPRRSGWLKRRQLKIEPGDTIVVPLDIDRRRTLAVWNEASAIIYQLALGAAAVNSF
jgi:protein involved in polysaccharide export with SLBB domain